MTAPGAGVVSTTNAANGYKRSSGTSYAAPAAWAYTNGVTAGTGKDTFSPDATCTRAQAVTFLYKANQLEK